MIRIHLSLFSRIALSLSILFMGSMFSIAYLIIINQNESIKKEREKLVIASTKTLADGSLDSLISGDYEMLERWLHASTLTDIYAYGYISDPNGRIIVHTDSKMIGKMSPPLKKIHSNTSRALIFNDKEVKEIIYTSSMGGQIFAYAHIAYYTSYDFLSTFKKDGFITILELMVLFLTLILFVTLIIIRRYTEPISELTKSLNEFSFNDNKKMSTKKLSNRHDEIGLLSQKFHLMTKRLNDAYNTLKDNEEKLQIKVNEKTEELLETQDQLIEAEKMSALGSLVAGIAHEVNTPLGVSITAASVFKHEILKIEKLLQNDVLAEKDLNRFLKIVSESESILMKNLDRAALLIKNFKEISVDQTSENKRDFELNKYLEEVIFTFHNELKNSSVSLELDLNKDKIYMDSYPGAISQIIINMLQNSLLHAFDDKQDGKIVISTFVKHENILIRFCDDGKGVDPSIKNNIFEPFITTKRNQGGTGLGLNITYNLITQRLKGTIKLDNKNQQGACFIITIPARLI